MLATWTCTDNGTPWLPLNWKQGSETPRPVDEKQKDVNTLLSRQSTWTDFTINLLRFLPCVSQRSPIGRWVLPVLQFIGEAGRRWSHGLAPRNKDFPWKTLNLQLLLAKQLAQPWQGSEVRLFISTRINVLSVYLSLHHCLLTQEIPFSATPELCYVA